MGIFDRLSTMLRSNINDLISRAENPEKMLNQLIIDMKSNLAKAKQEVASAIADEKKLQADAETMRKQAEDWERRAMLAVQEGRDDLAKQALLRYNEHLQGAQQLHETVRQARRAIYQFRRPSKAEGRSAMHARRRWRLSNQPLEHGIWCAPKCAWPTSRRQIKTPPPLA